MRSVLPIVLALLALPSLARALSVESLRDPRPGSHVIDPRGVLSPEDVGAIDRIASRGREGGELLVAVIDTTDGSDPRGYTTRLFNRLGLDDGRRSRGVLLLAATDDRAAEIVVGDGFPSGVTRTTDRIMSEVVVARFRRGDARGAMVEGSRALVNGLLLAADQAPPPELPAGERVPATRGPNPRVAPWPGTQVITGAGGQEAPDFSERHPFLLWGGTGGGLLGLYLGGRRVLRRRARTCPGCRQKMVRLDEQADDAHLSPAERTEERLGSVDYDIWMCPACQRTLKLRYGAFFTRYSKCRSCQATTLETQSTTIVPATQYSTGTARVDEHCAHCGFSNSYTRTIPRRPKPSSSRRSSFGGSSRGSSSGRGSSGRW